MILLYSLHRIIRINELLLTSYSAATESGDIRLQLSNTSVLSSRIFFIIHHYTCETPVWVNGINRLRMKHNPYRMTVQKLVILRICLDKQWTLHDIYVAASLVDNYVKKHHGCSSIIYCYGYNSGVKMGEQNARPLRYLDRKRQTSIIQLASREVITT
ncbi:hypothetical protein BDV32DRAFT_83761 [Aspergillus pseudonomiae]|uniref:Uncharacterized protein n=1 Tax=Aspergillus pseudonomiae TaxID=1506151 RepID=A0A5N7DS35_9EURO|nr:uncharacterized protein BDV37DRAFT_110215 [Aspergillus pseudonomiae]KAB8264399.1 hypothetical protein BDV32DRAFT_83761 [Aspergillus pseudonomiae]KAE8409252.1 hypothetical protein BDV37DRAFT_110215 [Aspergillus pseudonomiae]